MAMPSEDRLIQAFKALCDAVEGGVQAVAERAGLSADSLTQVYRGYPLPSGSPRGIGRITRQKLDDAYPGWIDLTTETVAKTDKHTSNSRKQTGLVRIDQFDAGGGMGRSRIVLHEQPGAIKSWEVDAEWVRLNVKGYTSIENLKIVTGFGPSMRPMFNPGDPLLVDVGVKSVTHDGVYFYRIGDDGYIKTLHRVPQDGGGRLLIARSKNIADFPDPVTINEKTMDFHVLAKVLTVWKSEQY